MAGVGEGRFEGDRIITRQEAINIAARTLNSQRGFQMAENPEDYLRGSSDAAEVADWARALVAMAARDGLVDAGSALRPLQYTTKAEAAELMYSLFMLLYETSPVAIQMAALDADAADAQDADSEAAQTDAQGSMGVATDAQAGSPGGSGSGGGGSSSTLPLVLGGVALLGLAGGGIFYAKRKKPTAPEGAREGE